jgi:aerobic C4-dicarboxylate transport protein
MLKVEATLPRMNPRSQRRGRPFTPLAGMALLIGVDRFIVEARSLTSFIGNAVATIVVARSENELDKTTLAAELSG